MLYETKVKVGERWVGDKEPVYIIAEIGINHNGSLETAKRLIDGAVFAGCDAVKFQKRTPDLCVPPEQPSYLGQEKLANVNLRTHSLL